MRRSIRSLFRWFSYSVLLILGLGTALSVWRIHKRLSRPVYSEKKKRLIEQGHRWYEQQGAEPVSFKTIDGLKLQGLLFLRPKAKRNVIICHGYHSAKELVRDFVAILPNDNIFVFDFRAHGESEGSRISLGYHEQKDLLAALRFVQQHPKMKHLPIYGIGVSMGGAVLLNVAAEYDGFKGIIIDSAFAELELQLARSFQSKIGLPDFPFRYLTEWIFEYIGSLSTEAVGPQQRVASLKIPVLFVHSADDRLVPAEDAHVLYNLACGQKGLWLVESCRHARVCKYFSEEYEKRLKVFFDAAEKEKS